MKKYYIGLIVIMIVVLGVTGVVMADALSAKQDKTTEKRAKAIAKDLNSYISKQRQIPESLEAADIKDVPDTISYTKESSTTYKICVTYKQSNRDDIGGFGSLLSGSALRTGSGVEYDSLYDDYQPSSLYFSYYHDEGENCQTIKPYATRSSSRLNDDLDDYQTTTPRMSTSTSSRARDTERQTDIKALHGQIEVYYAQNGRYPTQVNMNDESFRAANLKGLDDDALKDPSGGMRMLVTNPTKNTYSYKVTSASGGTCDNKTNDCRKYTLTATLESGGTYTKQNLN